MEISHFERKGFQIFRSIIPDATIRHIVNFLGKEVRSLLQDIRGKDSGESLQEISKFIQSSLGTETSNQNNRETLLLMTGHFPADVRLSQLLWKVADAPKLRCILEAIFGSKQLYMHMPPMARFVLPGNIQAGVPPHQDAAYNGHMSDFVTVWIPLVEIDKECGGIRIYTDQIMELIPTTIMVANGVWIEGIDVSGMSAEDMVPMTPGDVLVFNKFNIHASLPNSSARIRYSMDCRFFSANQTSSKHKLDLSTFTICSP